VWYGIGYPKQCWIWAYGKTHGRIGLAHALTASCDITFYQVGLILDKKDQELMPTFAYAFGLGSETGIGIEENGGHVPDPKDQQPWIPTDPVDMAIGQDTFLVSPLQIVDFVAAVANGGTMWKPRLIAKVEDIVNGTVLTPPTEKRADLPVSANNLKIIRDALKGVTTDKDGTATFVFQGLPLAVAGKTGTAQVPGTSEPHAWFAGYAPADNPQIACVVMVENGGEGSQTSAPLFRKVMEKYFHIQPTPTPPAKGGKPGATPTPIKGQGD
jgi:penicillin-binding protein 2